MMPMGKPCMMLTKMPFDLGANNTPPHLLQLAEGGVVFLMRTLDKRKKLTTNTRL